jgi:hypothetical protein
MLEGRRVKFNVKFALLFHKENIVKQKPYYNYANLLILLLALPVLAQNSAPQWVDESWRTARYPNTEWYTGFARDKAKGSPNQAKFKAIEKDAQNSLSESIVVHIQGASSVENTSIQQQNGKNHSETITRNYKQAITTASNAVVAKMETYSHFDKESDYIYGFAAVRKRDLAEFYRTKIDNLLSFAENEFSLANQLAEIGKKKSALNKINAISDSLLRIDYWRNLLQAVASITADSHSAEIMRKINTAKISLENSIIIYLKVSGNEYVAEELPAMLQEKGCNCTVSEMAGEADYSITVNTKFNRCKRADIDEVYCYASANVSVENVKTKRPVSVKVPEGKGGWAGDNKDRATEKAFEDLTANIAEKILKEMEK